MPSDTEHDVERRVAYWSGVLAELVGEHVRVFFRLGFSQVVHALEGCVMRDSAERWYIALKVDRHPQTGQESMAGNAYFRLEDIATLVLPTSVRLASVSELEV